MKKRARLFVMLLCCIMVFGMFPITTNAATAETQQPFLFDVDKNVVKGGEAAPGEENFTFELEYGIIGENEQHSVVFTPDDSVTLADCGIDFTNDTITTGGEGKETFTMGGTIDLEKVNTDHHWQTATGNDGVTKSVITFRLTEKNDGKAGWTYSDVERYLTITVIGNEIFTDVHLLGNDVSDNNFENIYTAYSFTVKKTDTDGKALAGATFSLTGTGDFEGINYEAVSGNDGIATFVVPEGNYTLAEKTAPEGYVKSNETYTLAVRNDYEHTALEWGGEAGVYFYDEDEPDYSNYKYIKYQQVTFVNKKAEVPKVPDTGDSAGMLVWASLMLAGVFGLTAIRRRENA